jgi:hypothetical protein
VYEFAVVRQSVESHVNFEFFTVGFLAHLYVPLLVFDVAPDFEQGTPLLILAAALAGTAVTTPAINRAANDEDAILRNM